MKDAAQKYHDMGFSVIPTNIEKKPVLKSWKMAQTVPIIPNGDFDSEKCKGIGMVCGYKQLECIDIDCKYDLTGNLFSDYKTYINQADKNLLKKLVVQKSQNNGYHFLYRCQQVEKNQKLAVRFATEAEKADNDKVKGVALIETRGVGGYFLVSPSEGYSFVYKDLSQLEEISPEEREILFSCAKLFNEVTKPNNEKIIYNSSTDSPFDEWNLKGDVEALLEQEGWTRKHMIRGNVMYLRPNGTQSYSAGWHPEKRMFHVFTSSTIEFDVDTSYNPTQVLSRLRFNCDYSATAKWLRENGYGTANSFVKSEKKEEIINIDDFTATIKDSREYLEKLRNGTFQMGRSTGFPELDKWWRFKDEHLVISNGHDNVGKSLISWYFSVLSAKMYGWKWIIFAGENNSGGVHRKLIEFYTATPTQKLSQKEYDSALEWVDEHFVIIKNLKAFTYDDMLEMGDKLLGRKQYNSFLIDPYNSLYRNKSKTENVHDYDYDALGDIRRWIETRHCCVYINCHCQTDAARRTYPLTHQNYAGQLMPPMKADTEGGGKFAFRSNDFLTIHRMTNHPTEWMWTEVHVRKVKENETGGRQTPLHEPFKMRLLPDGVGFEDETGFNPITKQFRENAPKSIRDFTEPTKIENEEDAPF